MYSRVYFFDGSGRNRKKNLLLDDTKFRFFIATFVSSTMGLARHVLGVLEPTSARSRIGYEAVPTILFIAQNTSFVLAMWILLGSWFQLMIANMESMRSKKKASSVRRDGMR